jgi:hypothetical protein
MICDWEFLPDWRMSVEYEDEDDVFESEEDDFLDCSPCASEACFGNWLGALA